MRHEYKSKINLKRENKVIILMISDVKKMALSCCRKIFCVT